MPEQRNLILAIVLSVTIIIGFQYFYELPRIQDEQRRQAAIEESTGGSVTPTPAPRLPPPARRAPRLRQHLAACRPTSRPRAPRETVLAAGERVAIDNGRLTGSFGVTGGRIDDVVMTSYHDLDQCRRRQRHLVQSSGLARCLFRGVRLGT